MKLDPLKQETMRRVKQREMSQNIQMAQNLATNEFFADRKLSVNNGRELGYFTKTIDADANN